MVNAVDKTLERELVDRVRQRDKQAFGELYDMFSGALYGVCLKLLSDTDEANDALQNAMIKAWERFDSYDAEKAALYTWLLNITRNHCIDQLRKKGRRPQIQDIQSSVSGAEAAGKSSDMRINENVIGLKEAVGKLNQDQKFVIDAAYFQGFTQQEISDEYDIPLGTVKTRMRSAMKELKRIFQ